MDPFDRRSGSQTSLLGPAVLARPGTVAVSRGPLARIYNLCESATTLLICCMVVFSPWAFGTTQKWSLWTMHCVGVFLGILLLAKYWLRSRTGHRVSRWDVETEADDLELFELTRPGKDGWAKAMAILTVLLLSYTFVSAVNARAVFFEGERRFEYRECLSWLPHSYDQRSTWNAFFSYLGLACFFWATRDWLLVKTLDDRRRVSAPPVVTPWGSTLPGHEAALLSPPSERGETGLPQRLRLLLWVLCLNGSALALEAILQRLSGTNRLLWLVVPSLSPSAEMQFGPYAYRANAASYFNLVWPVCLGFWLLLRRRAKASAGSKFRAGSGSYLVLLPGSVLMAACPIISSNRGGALIAVASILISMAVLLWASRHERLGFRLGTCSLFAAIIALGAFLGYQALVPRFQTLLTDQMSRRAEIKLNALPIARDFPILGTGPGTFGVLYQLYRHDVTQHWAAYGHDDWLETRITFGWVGFVLILGLLGTAAGRCYSGRGISVPPEFIVLLGTAMTGVLWHAKFDFPFQIYSIVVVFLLLAAVLSSLGKARSA